MTHISWLGSKKKDFRHWNLSEDRSFIHKTQSQILVNQVQSTDEEIDFAHSVVNSYTLVQLLSCNTYQLILDNLITKFINVFASNQNIFYWRNSSMSLERGFNADYEQTILKFSAQSTQVKSVEWEKEYTLKSIWIYILKN